MSCLASTRTRLALGEMTGRCSNQLNYHTGIMKIKNSIKNAVRTGLEPATLGVTGRYSNQLNYRTIFNQCFKEFLF